MTRGRKPVISNAPGGLTRAPKAPAWLPEEARREWKRVVPGLIERRSLTTEDLATLEAYCNAVGDVQRATIVIAKDGDTIRDGSGKVSRHPAYGIKYLALAEMRRLAAELGLTPASRKKAPATQGEAGDGWTGLAD